MPPTNDFVPFCNENTGTNLPSQAAYLANPNLPIGNQPGIASSSLNNKAIRQGSTIAAIIAQFTSNTVGADMLDNQNTADHAIPAALLGALTAAMKHHSPVTTSYLSGSGNHNVTYKFQIATGNATVAATYSDGTTTYTVKTTIASGTQLDATGAAAPSAVSGTLTKTGGTGDATLTYYAYRAPLFLKVKLAGPGGGGGGSGTGTSAGNGNNGTAATTFGTTLLSAGVGVGGLGGRTAGVVGGNGGSASLGTGPSGLALGGGKGGYGAGANLGTEDTPGGMGGTTAFGGAGSPGGSSATSGTANTGAGGGGGGNAENASCFTGSGGGSGAYVEAVITSPLSTYAYVVGAGGTGGTAGTSGSPGGNGGSGVIIVEECYQQMETQPAALNIPSEVYYVIGALVVMNFGTFVTIVFAAIKVVWWAAKADSRINEAKAMSVRAHKRIDTFEDGDD